MTKLERRNPALTALAATVLPDQRIHHRAGSYWLGDVQLTYNAETTGGVSRPLGKADSPENAALAERILRRCLAAREQPAWGSRWERCRRILIGLREEVVPEFRTHHFCHFRHPSLDDGWLFRSRFGAHYTAGVHLVGDVADIQTERPTLEAAIEALWTQLAPEGERPPWHGPCPEDCEVHP